MSDTLGPSDVTASSGRARLWLLKYPRALPAAVFLAIAAITALSAFALESNANERKRAEIREYSQTIATSLERRGNGFSSYLRAGAALFATLEEVTPPTFRQFVAELRLDQNYRGADGIGWAEVIAQDEVDAFLERTRASQPEFPAIRPHPAGEKSALAPVTYFSLDTSRNRRVLGFDMLSEPVRSAAMEEAEQTVIPTASGRIVLGGDEGSGAPGFIMFMPVYKPVPGSPTLERELAGFLFSSFNAQRFLDAAIERAPEEIVELRLYDGAASEQTLLASRLTQEARSDRFEQELRVANRDLLLVINSRADHALAPLTMLTLVFGIALASILMLVMRLLAKQVAEDRDRLTFLEEQNSIRNSLSRELNHRVKNTLANVLSMLALTRHKAHGLDQFADSLEGRIRALSATHDLLTVTDWGTTPIEAVVRAEMQHFVDDDTQSLSVEGPEVELAPNDALSFGLAIHELGTNAAKYGALSVPGGKVSVRWSLASDNLAKVVWTESGGPEVSAEYERGFGLQLVEKITAHELKHDVEMEFRPEGVRCSLGVAVRSRGEFQVRSKAE